MWRDPRWRACPFILFFAAGLAGCQDSTAPDGAIRPAFSQGTDGVWTVNVLADPGDGVCDDVECTLREAVADAASGDSVVFAAGLEGDVQLADEDIRIFSKALVVNGDGRITVRGPGDDRVFTIASASDPLPVNLTGLAIANGVTPVGGRGGGIYAENTVLVLEHVRLFLNSGDVSGGAMSIENSDVRILHSTLRGNGTFGNGGGIYATDARLTVLNSTLDGNAAVQLGGGIYLAGGTDLTVLGSVVSDNQADNVGGIAATVFDNVAIERSTISGNIASAVGGTGGLLIPDDGIVRSSTITRNRGGFVGGLNGSIEVVISNSILAGNEGGGECEGFPTSGGYNVTTAGAGCDFTQPGDRQVMPTQVFTEVLDPELSDNGGPTHTHALVARGRAIDAGYCPGETEDQRGFGRPVDDALMANALDGCDIGAFEAQGPFVPVADLMISQSVDKPTVKLGDRLTYTIRVQNLGPQTAPDVVMTNVLSSGVTFVAARVNKGSTTAPPAGETGTVTWYLGELLDEANEVAEIEVTVRVKGRTSITNTSSVTADADDPNPANNTAAIQVSVGPGGSAKKR